LKDAILSKPRHFEMLRASAPNARLCTDLDEIRDGGDHLICYGTGVIVPSEVLNLWRWRYNFHAAPPAYPGRDPHHWASYDNARVYGATAHVMTAKVDDGPIVGTLLMGVTKDSTPKMLLQCGERCAASLFAALAPLMLDCGVPPNGACWSGTKRSRSDLLALLSTPPSSELDALLREVAFDGFRLPLAK